MPALEPFAALFDRPDRAGLFCDFDGTLAEIVMDPAAATPVAGAADVLERLARRYARVGIISGRPAEFLQHWFGGRGLVLSGLYGLELVTGNGIAVHPEAAAWRPVVDQAATAGERAGMSVERKGLTATFHYRSDPDRETVTRTWAEAEAAQTGLVLTPARMSYELRPPVARDKGVVLAEHADGLVAAAFTGDDRGDLEAFDALDRLAAQGVATVRVGVRSSEAPAELIERADVLLDGPVEVVELLDALARPLGY